MESPPMVLLPKKAQGGTIVPQRQASAKLAKEASRTYRNDKPLPRRVRHKSVASNDAREYTLVFGQLLHYPLIAHHAWAEP